MPAVRAKGGQKEKWSKCSCRHQKELGDTLLPQLSLKHRQSQPWQKGPPAGGKGRCTAKQMKARYSFILCPGVTDRQCAVSTSASFFSYISHAVYTFFQKLKVDCIGPAGGKVLMMRETFLFSNVSAYNASLRKSLLSNLETILPLENQTRLETEEFVFSSSVSMTESAPNGV